MYFDGGADRELELREREQCCQTMILTNSATVDWLVVTWLIFRRLKSTHDPHTSNRQHDYTQTATDCEWLHSRTHTVAALMERWKAYAAAQHRVLQTIFLSPKRAHFGNLRQTSALRVARGKLTIRKTTVRSRFFSSG